MYQDLIGKTVLVTGAARGIGFTIASMFVAGGAKVVIGDILDEQGLTAAASLGPSALFVHLDVTNDEQWAAAIRQAENHFDGLDIVVNNAGIESAALIGQIEVADFRRVFDVNVLGVMLGTKHAFRSMRPEGSTGRGGAIVNIASAAAIMQATGLSVYSASKAAVAHFTRNAAKEAGASGYHVRSNCIMPGMTETDMAQQLGDDLADIGLIGGETTFRQTLTARLPMKRYAAPSEIAAVALFLASDAASYMSGASLPVEGAAALQ